MKNLEFFFIEFVLCCSLAAYAMAFFGSLISDAKAGGISFGFVLKSFFMSIYALVLGPLVYFLIIKEMAVDSRRNESGYASLIFLIILSYIPAALLVVYFEGDKFVYGFLSIIFSSLIVIALSLKK